MRRLLRASLVALSFAAVAGITGVANAGPMDSLFGNTVVLTYDGQPPVKVFVDADGGYSVQSPDGNSSSGTWEVKGGKVCYTQTSPAPPADAKPVCLANQAHAVGETWTGVGVGGANFTAVIEEGRN
jgi:hypothetical protein